MTRPSRINCLRGLFWFASQEAPPTNGAHVVDDDELLTCWAHGLLSATERDSLLSHLAACSRCRRELAELIRSGVLNPQGSAFAPGRRGVLRFAIGVGLAAAAAAVVLAVWSWFPTRSSGPQDLLAETEKRLEQRQPEVALARLERLLEGELSPDLRQRAEALLERAGYEQGREDLHAGRFQEVKEIGRRVSRHGVRSARLCNLELEAERQLPAEIALVPEGMLTQYGYELDGSAPRKGLPTLDVATERRWRTWEQAVKDYPGNPILQVNFGQFLLSLSEIDEAGRQFESALKSGGAEVAARLGLGLVEYEREQYPQALGQFKAALDADPDSLAACVNVAVCMERMGQKDQARVYWERARRLAGDPLRRHIDRHLGARGGRPPAPE